MGEGHGTDLALSVVSLDSAPVIAAAPVIAGGLLDDVGSLIGRGQYALNDLGDLRLSRHWFELACRAAERVGDRTALAEAAAGLGGLWLHEHRNAADRARVHSWQSRAVATTNGDSNQHLHTVDVHGAPVEVRRRDALPTTAS